jgi:hypothetical protein
LLAAVRVELEVTTAVMVVRAAVLDKVVVLVELQLQDKVLTVEQTTAAVAAQVQLVQTDMAQEFRVTQV